ncbi:MAG: protein phosphatase CheZ [Labrys sp. (in: a-proteobacteria)]|jgi:chemotaxis protein CheZ
MAAADNVHFNRVISYLRDRKETDVSLNDVVALAEITAESFQAFFASMDAAIYRELREIASYITTMKEEIGALQPNDLKARRIPDAGRELDLIVQSTADATNTIMECAEAIMAADATDPNAYKAFVDDKMIMIFEACSFQDITGQRVAKVVDTLQQIEKRVTRFASAINAKDASGFADEAERRRLERAQSLMLHGPQDKGAAIDQTNVDALLQGSGQDAIDALFD